MLVAQPPVVDAYQVRVITKDGSRIRGILSEVTETYLYVDTKKLRSRRPAEPIPLQTIRKVVIRRFSKKSTLITGAIVGGLITGYLSNESLKKNRPSNAINYGLTLTFAAAGGAAGGLLVSSAIGNLASRVVRPLDPVNPEISLFRQLEPFSVRYQQNIFDQLPKNPR